MLQDVSGQVETLIIVNVKCNSLKYSLFIISWMKEEQLEGEQIHETISEREELIHNL